MKGFKSQKISLGEKVGYSLGDAAANLVFQMMMIRTFSDWMALWQAAS